MDSSVFILYSILFFIVPRRFSCCGSNCFMFKCRIFVLVGPYVYLHPYIYLHIRVFSYIRVTACVTASPMAYDTLSWYKYLIVNLVFSHLGISF